MWKWRTGACGLAVLFVCGACADDDGPGGPNVPPGGFDNPGPIVSAGQGGGQAAGGVGLGGGGSGVGGTGLPPGTCADGVVRTRRVAPRVVLVLDGSCSMSTNYPANGQASATRCTDNQRGRWAALRNSLIHPESGVVTKLQSIVEFGVAVYGTQPSCPLPTAPVQPALNNLPMIQARIPSVQPGMYTPTGPALDWVYDNMIEAEGPDRRNTAQVVILATDGEPNSCGGGSGQVTTNYQPSIDAVRKGSAKGATTYVISLADASGPFHDHLQELANLGNPAANGSAMLYEPSSPAQLEANLSSLVGAAVSCEIELNGAVDPASACTGVVTLDGAVLGCNAPNGWALVDQSHIRLQGTACDTLKNNTDADVEARFSCTAFRPD